jgi:zinc D-Ala-D-Ala dipeptidase
MQDMYTNIRNRFYIAQLLFFIFLTINTGICAQSKNDSALKVISKLKAYKKQVEAEAGKKMIELKTLVPGLVYDLRYASENNFMKRRMYPSNTNITFLRQPAAIAIAAVQQELNQKGLGLKIFDAYRPYSVTVKFWELVKDERYVANPAKGSGHNRGIAVDLTIIHLDSGKEFDMGTGFDNFSDTAHWAFTNLSEEVLQNRNMLKTIMEKNGFKALDTEWWHFFLPNSGRYEVLNIPFKKLNKDIK